MCDITNTISEQKFGFKVLAMKDGKFYSTFTSQEISVGKVPEINHHVAKYRPMSHYWNSDVTFLAPIKWGFFKSDLVGKSSAFLRFEHAQYLLSPLCNMQRDDSYRFVIVKITFADLVYQGIYSMPGRDFTEDRVLCPCIAGDTIKSIEII